jgi:polyprenyl-phospho-N-acetylgalactosaminyl synthase
MKNIFIVIPAYNEEKNIGSVIDGIKNKLAEVSVVVVDDNSLDNTFNEVKKRNVFVLKHIVNRGQGAALQTGNDFALSKGADIIVHFDGDGQHRVEDINKLIQPIIEKEAQIVLGSRFLEDKSDIPLTKKFLILKPALLVNYFFTGIKLSDAHNGLRALSAEVAKKIKITQDKMAHNTEIISEIKRNKLKYKEVPVEVIYNEYGQGFFDGLKILKDLIIKKIL